MLARLLVPLLALATACAVTGAERVLVVVDNTATDRARYSTFIDGLAGRSLVWWGLAMPRLRASRITLAMMIERGFDVDVEGAQQASLTHYDERTADHVVVLSAGVSGRAEVACLYLCRGLTRADAR